MFRFLFFVLVFLCVSFVSKTLSLNSVPVYNYNVTIRTASSPKFTSYDGNLTLYINSTDPYGSDTSEGEFLLTQKVVKLMVNSSYTARINSHTSLANMTGVYLRWIVDLPINPYCLINKPVIYFNSIAFSFDSYSHDYYLLTTQNRKFCPRTRSIGIEHADGASFYPCY